MAARRIIPTPTTAAKTIEMRAVPRIRIMSESPSKSPVSPLVIARNDCADVATTGNGVSYHPTGSDAPQLPRAIPIKLWRNPNLQPTAMSPLIRVAPPCENSPAGNVQVQGAEVSGDKSDAPPKGTVFVVKKMENGKTIITAQEVPGNASVEKIAKEAIAASNAQARTFSPVFAKPSPPPPRADTPRCVISVPDKDGSFVTLTLKHSKKTGPSETRIVYPRQKNLAHLEGRKEVSVGTQTGNSGKGVPKSKNPPAVVHIVPVPEPAKATSRLPKSLDCIKVSDSLVCVKPSVAKRKVQEQVQPETAEGDQQGKAQGGCCIKQEPPETVEDACSQQEDDDGGGWDIKISNVVSLAGREEDMSDAHLEFLCADKNGGGDVHEVAQSVLPGSAHTDKKTIERVSEVKETLFSMCKLREVEGDCENESIELCSFQTTKGNSVMGSQIVFKPAPRSSNGGKDFTPGSKVEKLKQAIKLFEESTLQDCSLFSEKEKVMLTSLFQRFKDDALAADSKPGPSKIETANGSQEKSKPEVRVKNKSLADEKPKAVEHDTQVGPGGHPETQGAKNRDSPVALHKPLRRIVITSDHVPTMNSEYIKAGIENFLVTNNISNNFCADEVIKLHWDGKDVTTFHFRETDSPPMGVPPKMVRPTILRMKKTSSPDTPAKDSASAVSAAAVPMGTTPTSMESKPEMVDANAQLSKTDSNEVKLPLPNFKPVRLKYVTDTGQVVEQVVIKAVKAMPALSGGGVQPDKQLAFMPRAIRYVKKTGEIIEQPVNPEQQVVPVYSSGPSAAAKSSSSSLTGNTQARSLLPNVKSLICVQPAAPTAESLKRLLDAARCAAPSPTYRKAERSYGSSTENRHDGAAPSLASRSVATKTEARGHEPSGSKASANDAMRVRQADEAALLASRMPSSCAESDDGARLFEPEVLLEESNSVIQVKPLRRQGPLDNDISSDETTTSSDDDYVPPFKKLAQSEARGHEPSGSKANANDAMRTQQAYEAALLASRMPSSCAESDDGARLFEPEVLLEESNSVIQVKPLRVQGPLDNDTSSDETTTSSDHDDYVRPFKKLAQSPKRPPAPKKQTTAVKKTTVQKTAVRRLSGSKRKRCRKRNAAARAPSAAPAAARRKRDVDVAMLSSNCIDRPCVVDMHRLNDRLFTKGFVDLSAVEPDDLFVLADSPEVKLSSEKVVSVVELKPRAPSASPEQEDADKKKPDADPVARLLREQKRELVQLRRRYKQPGMT